jgi:2-iminobutanoate/2-iminopropanoate deaminase
MSKQSILTSAAPAPIGPYSQAILAGNTLYCSGQIALDPVSGELRNSDILTETRQVMSNVEAVLKQAGFGFENVVKTSIFLNDMKDFQAVNSVYETYFQAPFPARETVQVAGLPRNANVEISIVAVK